MINGPRSETPLVLVRDSAPLVLFVRLALACVTPHRLSLAMNSIASASAACTPRESSSSPT